MHYLYKLLGTTGASAPTPQVHPGRMHQLTDPSWFYLLFKATDVKIKFWVNEAGTSHNRCT